MTITAVNDARRITDRRPREGGDPVAFEKKTLGSRLRGNDEVLLMNSRRPREGGDPVTFVERRWVPAFARKT